MNAERSIIRSLIVRFEGDHAGNPREDFLAVEEPLEIQLGYDRKGWRVHKSVSITMRTPGTDEDLAAGFLFTEGIVTGAAQIDTIRSEEANVVRVELRDGVPVDLRRLERHFYTTSSCGVCGKASIAALDLGPRAHVSAPGPVFDAATIHRLPATLRETQAVFDQTGGLHAAALFASFELVQKALAAGLPILAAVGAPSSLAVGLATSHGMTLLGFVRGGRFNVYAGERRIHPTAGVDSAVSATAAAAKAGSVLAVGSL